MITKYIVLHIPVTNHLTHLRVNHWRVVGLHKAFHRHFPVAVQVLANMHGDIPVLKPPLLKMLR